jgi:hypothetical protein
MKKLLIIIIILYIPMTNYAQLVIGATAVLAASGNPDITVQSIGTLTNNSTFDFSTTNLHIDLSGSSQNIVGDFVLSGLALKGAGVKTLNGNLTITNKIIFEQGILSVPSTGKILFTGSADGIDLSKLSNTSYVDGIFHNSGGAPKKFPIGTNNLFAAAIIPGTATDEVGMRVNTGSSQLKIVDNVELISINVDRYWEITAGLAKIESPVVLSLNGLDSFINANDEGSTAVAQGPTIDASAENLGSESESDDGTILSSLNVTAPILAIAKEINVVLKIHDLITPFGSPGKNDKLMIQNLNRFDFNTVTLLDRWGVQVAVWKDYNNETTNYDFSKLGPGNYICIVQYGKKGGETKVAQQMVTVIKTN